MLVHQVGSGLSSHGGPAYTVPALCRSLSEHGVDVVLHALEPLRADAAGSYETCAHPASAFIPRLGLSRSMRRALTKAAVEADIIHSHMLWMMPNIYPGLIIKASRGRACLVMSPRGTLDPWEYQSHKLQKRIAWFAGQRMNLQMSSILHATAPMEAEHFRVLGLKPPIAVIPNGVEIPDLSSVSIEVKTRRRLLYFARIAPKKGVDLLLQAWRAVQARRPDWELQIAGDPNGNYLIEMQRLARALGVDRVTFFSPVSTERKWVHYRNADLYVLPTRGDNWGVSISDALSFGIPAIVSKAAPWEGLETHRCGWWIDLSVEALTDTLYHATNQDSATLLAMGERGREWMSRDFSWDVIGATMKATYQWVLSGGPRPSWIIS